MLFTTKNEHAEYFSKVARESWFKDHQIDVTELSADNGMGITVVDFYKPGTICYSVRYIYSGHFLYVTGDLGDAVFNCTWKTKPVDSVWKNLWYVFEKLSASENGRSRQCMDFDDGVCKETIRQTLLDTCEDGRTRMKPDHWSEYQSGVFTKLLNAADDCSSRDSWAAAIQEVDRDYDLGRLDADWWEWLYGAGDVMPARMVGIITGLQIVSERLCEIQKFKKGEYECLTGALLQSASRLMRETKKP